MLVVQCNNCSLTQKLFTAQIYVQDRDFDKNLFGQALSEIVIFLCKWNERKKYTSSESIYLQWTDSSRASWPNEQSRDRSKNDFIYVVCSSISCDIIKRNNARVFWSRHNEETSFISFHYFFSRGETPPGQEEEEEEEKRQQNGGPRRKTATLLDNNYNRGTSQSNHSQAHHFSSPFSYILWPSWHHDNTAITVFNATTTGQLRLHWYDQISYSREYCTMYSEFNSTYTSFEKKVYDQGWRAL